MRPVVIRGDDDLPPPPRQEPRRRWSLGFLLPILFLLAIGLRTIAGYVIEFQWWKEVGQVETWLSMLSYGFLPIVAAAITIFVLLWLAHRQGVQHAGVYAATLRNLGKFAALILLVVSVLIAISTVDPWTVVRFFGGGRTGGEWSDPVFGESLSFYLFRLPMYRMLLGMVITVVIAAMIVYWASARGTQLYDRLRSLGEGGGDIDIRDLRLGELLESKIIRAAATVGLLALALRIYFGRYDLLYEDHGFMTGIDYVSEVVRLPAAWGAMAACIAAAGLFFMGRVAVAVIIVAAALIVPGLAANAVNWLRVRPNEISIQRPFIERHIAGTRAAFGLDKRAKEVEFAASMEARFNAAEHRIALENVRLWDWQAFHDTIAQIQALRPYYVFADSDVDRYMLPDKDGKLQMQQVLLAPRELDVNQLPDARTRWINPHFIYTHGYGVVMAEANRITPDGLPQLFIQDAPPEIRTAGLKLTRPEIYYGEAVHEPVFVRTAQPEFNYPSGSENVHSRYEGPGGFPISSVPMRVMAALREGDWNILLTNYLTPESRMMIRRNVRERLTTIAAFLHWDRDPYLVVTNEGRLVWMADGYTTSDSHPYSRSLRVDGMGAMNYVRNAVKATVDAYDGTITLYIFDDSDPIVAAYRQLFPKLFRDKGEMPDDLRQHARYPETIFRIQAEVYRTFHMRDPEAFYNKEDVWDVARNTSSQESQAVTAIPTYIVGSLPGSREVEFLLMIPFTPRNKSNLIGLMVARCDGEHLGEIVFAQLSKQQLVFGPMQIKARINQDQNIAKDLALWNQQGSKVIRGQMLVLPVGETLLYVEPIYLQAAQAPMPQLRKVALATGSQLAYADTYEEALAQLIGSAPRPAPERTSSTASGADRPASGGAPPAAGAAGDPRVDQARQRLQRYRDLMSEGKFSEAGRELEALRDLLK